METPDLADLIETSEAARLLKVSHCTIDRWVKQGRLRAWKVGGRRRVLLSEVTALPEPILPRQPAPRVQTRSQQRAATTATLERVWPGIAVG